MSVKLLVVSDASPIRCLANIELLHVLPAMFDEVVVPPAVMRELTHPISSLPSVRASSLGTLVVRPPTDRAAVARWMAELDAGESEAIALAEELRPHLLLMDELAGRRVAESLGFRVTGVIGVLSRARDRDLIPAAAPCVERLRNEFGFWVSDALIAALRHEDSQR
jgi:uncharacterized protein